MNPDTQLKMELNDRVNKLEQGIARIEERVDGVRSDISEIKNNHLVHLQRDIKDVAVAQAEQRSQIDKMTTKLTLILSGITIVIQLVFQLVFR